MTVRPEQSYDMHPAVHPLGKERIVAEGLRVWKGNLPLDRPLHARLKSIRVLPPQRKAR